MKLKEIALSRIRENSYNPNVMPEELFDALVASIRDFGYVQPIVVRPSGRFYEVVDGAHRLRALQALGRERASCVVVEDDEQAAKLRTLAMNRLRGRMDNFGVARIIRSLKRKDTHRYLALSPRDHRELEGLLRPPRLELPASRPPVTIMLGFTLERNDAHTVHRALEAAGEASREKSLLAVCRDFLRAREDAESA